MRRAPTSEAVAAIWDLLWSGRITNDTLGPIRTLVAAAPRRSPTRPARATRPAIRSLYRLERRDRSRQAAGLGADVPTRSVLRTAPNGMAGRWSQLPERNLNPTTRALAAAEVMLDRYGVLTRGAVAAERWPGGFSAVYPVLKAAEERGRIRRGYFVDGLGAAQFALPGAIERLRGSVADERQVELIRGRDADPGPGRDRPGQPVRRGAALAGADGIGRRARRRTIEPPSSRSSAGAQGWARWSSWSTVPACSTSSGVGARCSRSPTT